MVKLDLTALCMDTREARGLEVSIESYSLLGVDDEVTTCEHCGKPNLKCTVVMATFDAERNDLGEVRFGRDCAAKAMSKRWRSGRAEKMEREARSIEYERLWSQRVKIGGRSRVKLSREGVCWPAYANLYALEDGRHLVQLPDERKGWIQHVPAGDWRMIKPGWLVGALTEESKIPKGSKMKLNLTTLRNRARDKAAKQQRQEPKLYRYGVPNRPIGYATVPKGRINVEPKNAGSPYHTRHGIVVYDRRLTAAEIAGYELYPIVSEDELVRKVMGKMSWYRDEYLELWHGDEADRRLAVQTIGNVWDRTKVIALDVTRDDLAKRIYAKLERSSA